MKTAYLQLAATHDRWFEDPAAQIPRGTTLVEVVEALLDHPRGIEWTASRAIAIAVVVGSPTAKTRSRAGSTHPSPTRRRRAAHWLGLRRYNEMRLRLP